jgi:hypothetical protein
VVVFPRIKIFITRKGATTKGSFRAIKGHLGAHLKYRSATNKFIHQVIIFFVSLSCVSL